MKILTLVYVSCHLFSAVGWVYPLDDPDFTTANPDFSFTSNVNIRLFYFL